MNPLNALGAADRVHDGVEAVADDAVDAVDPGLAKDVDWVPPFSSGPDVVALRNLTGLRLLQLMSADADVWIDHVPKGVTLCDARGVHTGSTSEWVVTAILASVREFPRFTMTQAAYRWEHVETDTLAGKLVLIVGAGDIARQSAAGWSRSGSRRSGSPAAVGMGCTR
jgi:phosphoglycerate dehydrogenase-like enzyme